MAQVTASIPLTLRYTESEFVDEEFDHAFECAPDVSVKDLMSAISRLNYSGLPGRRLIGYFEATTPDGTDWSSYDLAQQTNAGRPISDFGVVANSVVIVWVYGD
eukprot:TRINITY_DN10417_c0_g1_i1.p1 TRINITY_DN10417_c0_g1~~TRINITY_DN10417_c0_g1_i1.p1  ORF type:complete len:104 (+),score=16.09 TRINITY_DN10417_c0_g1_i1:118-429(+)